jgi:hypothetical protein
LYKKRGRAGRPKKVKSEPKVSVVETKEKNIPEIGTIYINLVTDKMIIDYVF